MANGDVRFVMFAGSNYNGRRILLRRGGIAIRDMGAFRFDENLSSFRLRNEANGTDVTLILFANTNFRGAHRVFRGNQNVADLRNFDNRTSSLIVVGRVLTDAEITRIRNNRRPPTDVLHVRQ